MSKEAKTAAISTLQTKIDGSAKEKALVNAAERLGGIAAVHYIAKSLNSQALRALESIQETKSFEAYGYTRFDDFLDKHPTSPMSSSQYYRQIELLKNEGDYIFDAFQAMSLPQKTRKLLKGQFQIEGDEIVVGEDRLPLSDTARVKAVLKDVAFQQEKQAKKVSDLDKEVKDLKAKLVETVKAASKAKPDKEAGSPFGQALLMVEVAMNELVNQIGELDQDELKLKQDNTLSRIGEKTRQVMEAFNLNTQPLKPKKAKKFNDDLPDEMDDDLFNE